MKKNPILPFAALLFGFTSVACGGEDEPAASPSSPYPYETDKTVVLSPTGDGTIVTTPDGNGCLDIGKAGSCVKPQESCKNDRARADVILDSAGNVVSVVCYPVAETPVETVNAAGVDRLDAANKAVIVLDGQADGDDIRGDANLRGNNAVLYGTSPDVSVIAGNLDVVGNNGIVRGVRIKGNVVIEGNNTNLIDCVIEGNLVLKSNNNLVARCQVFGNVETATNNNSLVGNRVAGAIKSDGAGNLFCDANVSFEDKNSDKIVAIEEVGSALSCGGSANGTNPKKKLCWYTNAGDMGT